MFFCLRNEVVKETTTQLFKIKEHNRIHSCFCFLMFPLVCFLPLYNNCFWFTLTTFVMLLLHYFWSQFTVQIGRCVALLDHWTFIETSLFFFNRKSQGKLLLMFVATSVFLNELNVQKENSEPSKCLLSKAK